MPQEDFSPNDSLQLINNMIQQAQSRFNDNGFLYLLWGWVIFGCSILHFAFIQLGWFKHPEAIWTICWVAIIFQVVYLTRKEKEKKVKTYSDEIIGYIWMTFGFCMFFVFFIVSKYQHWSMLYQLVLMLYGIPTFLSGAVMRFRPLQWGGGICWLLSLVGNFVPGVYILLLLSVAVVAAWIVPGYILRAQYQQQNS
jgi:hypothetical protein